MNNVRMPTLVKFGFALLVLFSSFAALPAPVGASCGIAPTVLFYRDAARTQLCGSCVYWCDDTVECSGDVNPNTCLYQKPGNSLQCPC